MWTKEFGNAAGWTFAIVGDIDVDAVAELARQYLGTLVATGAEEPPLSITPEPPPGVIAETVPAGTGDRATVLRLYSSRAPSTARATVLADAATEIVSNRIVSRLREELGESYAPFATFALEPARDGGDDFVDLYLEIAAAPAQVDAVVATLSEEMASLVTDGPTDAEIDAALAVLTEQYNYVDNAELTEVLLATRSGIGRTVDEYLEGYFALRDIRDSDVRAYLSSVIPVERYIEVRAVPR